MGKEEEMSDPTLPQETSREAEVEEARRSVTVEQRREKEVVETPITARLAAGEEEEGGWGRER